MRLSTGLVQSVSIIMGGEYCLDNLKTLGYTQDGDYWEFEGRMHKYLFSPLHHGIQIYIMPKTPDMMLLYQITFGQINEWVARSVRATLAKTGVDA